MECPYCGAPVREGAKFCGDCGSPIPEPEAAAPEATAPEAAAPSAPVKKGMATASLVLGILALIGAITSSWTVVLGVPCLVVSILGLIFGIVGASKKQGGTAIAGIVLCVISIAAGVLAMGVTTAVFDVVNSDQGLVTVTTSDDEDAEADNPDNIKIKGIKYGTNSTGDRLAYVTFSWQNNSSKRAVAFFTTYSAKAYQDGLELSEGMDLSYDDDLYADQKEVKKGKKQTFTKCYVLDDKKHDVEVEVTDWINWGDGETYASKTFKLK